MRAPLLALPLLLLAPPAAASLDVGVDEPIREVAPGDTATMKLILRNDGDAPLPVSFSLEQPPPRGSVTLPPGGVLEPGASREFAVAYRSVADFGYQNRPESFTVRIEAGPHVDRVSLLVTTKGLHVPSPGALAPVAALLAVALARRA